MLVNGKKVDGFENKTVLDLLDSMNIDRDTVVVELDFNILNKEEYKDKKLSSESKVEIITFVGGG